MNYPLDTVVVEKLWAKQASNLPWYTPWEKVCDGSQEQIRWFVGGQLNASYACLDVHVKAGKGKKVAIYWQGEQGQRRKLTYGQLYAMVNRYAALLQQQGVKKGDVVVLYLPMIPEAVAMMLAVVRLGGVHAVVFSGFSAAALRERIVATGAKIIVTADVGYRRGKTLHLKPIVDQAAEATGIEKVLVIQRSQEAIQINQERDVIVSDCDDDEVYVEPEKVESSHPLFILYTSGTTGVPKGIMHGTGGYLTYVYSTIKWAFGINEESIYWCTADIGWITGHSYVTYGPLLHGASMVMVEGAPDYPTPDVWWKIIQDYRVSIFYTSPTALRMFMKQDEAQIAQHDFSCLKILGSVGEPINPEVWRWYDRVIGRQQCPVIDTWWQTETGGFMISPMANQERITLKPGSATLPLPGVIADVVDERGESVPANTKGFLVIKRPWPGMAIGIFGDQERFKEIYWSKFPGAYYSGDYARKDSDGYFWLLGRADEVLNIAGHRIGTAEIESAVLMHGAVAEVAAVPVADQVKGEQVVLFVTLKDGIVQSPHLIQEIMLVVRKEIGAFVTPREVFVVQQLPKTRSGKIMRRLLKAALNGNG
ncbi:MAG: acetate--CoA ligase, partial [Candidatus Babeliales bacterium]